MRTTLRTLATALLITSLAGVAAAQDSNSILEEIENAFIRLGEEVRPAVVNIEADRTVEGPGGRGMPDMDMFDDFFRFFGIPERDRDMMPQPQPRRVPATGSGFIIDEDGHIITNNHVIANAEGITVRLYDGEEYSAQVVGGDPDTDIAVIRIDANRDLPTAELGDSEGLKVGQFAVAIGSPQGLEGSLSFGHISALGRQQLALPDPDLRFQNFIQTDAAINLGNSGGPLVNINGEVIGINTAIVFGADSLGFAIPINLAKRVVPELIADGRVTRGYLGVEITDAQPLAQGLGMPDNNGAFVENVREGTPAEEAGLQTYDVIRSVDGQTVQNATDVVYMISDISPGSTVTLEVWRDEELVEIEVTLAEYDAPGAAEPTVTPEDEIGLHIEDLPSEMLEQLQAEFDIEGGVLVANVAANSPGEEAGVMRGDILLEIARQPVTSASEYQSLVEEHAQPGSSVLLRVLRAGQRAMVLSLTVPEE